MPSRTVMTAPPKLPALAGQKPGSNGEKTTRDVRNNRRKTDSLHDEYQNDGTNGTNTVTLVGECEHDYAGYPRIVDRVQLLRRRPG